ncbi:MAG: DUF499 domain-containing protein [Victivallales bacterium]|nr:DUF499 domain-containing protein [Victivallales bacterium]
MEILLQTAFKRFQGKSETGVIKLTQAMGGGKTHNMLALALLAQNPNWRTKLLGHDYDDVTDVKVIAFNGRESDAPYGIWGSLAEQLGKKDLFNDLYAPLKAPGETAWINLLSGQNILILLDELPPYLENARAIQIGASNLCNVTVTALSNLFNALGKAELANVCLVFSDLKATYESGSALIQRSFRDLENEANRVAINIEPVALNSDEIYDILRKRLFEKCPTGSSTDVISIATEYKSEIEKARRSGLTNYQADKMFLGVRDSYPFHPSIKELYARFKENQNFQQTRGLIRLMRQIIRQFYESGRAKQTSLISVFDIDLNNPTMVGFIRSIKPSLDNAINHDIAQHGKGEAEIIDEQNKAISPFPYAQMLAKLLLMSSLNDTPNGVLGLNESDIFAYLCEPNIDLNQYGKVFEDIKAQCWYLKQDNRGRHYFQNTKNMVAEMNSLVDGYTPEHARKFLRAFLEEKFAPKLKRCYETLFVMPAVDEIKADKNKIALVIYEPCEDSGMHPDLQRLYDNSPFKNRLMFLSGQRRIMDKLFENSKKLTAIRQIIKTMKDENISENDQQYLEAQNQEAKVLTALISSIKETFITLYYPTASGLESSDFKLEFTDNNFNGEEQIVKTLIDAQKFEEFSADDAKLETMRKKCEKRLFTTKEMTWEQLLERAATTTAWQWYNPAQFDALKRDALLKDKWREKNGYLEKGPFAKEPTEVSVSQIDYNETTHTFKLNVRPVYGNKVYYEVGAEPTTASKVVSNPFETKETDLYFLCVDESADNPHPTGKALHYHCVVKLKVEQRATTRGQVVQLQTHPDFEVRYTTDGSNPKESGGLYNGEISIPNGCRVVQVAVFNHGQLQEERTIEINESNASNGVTIDEAKPLKFTFRSKRKCNDTASSYSTLSDLQRLEGVELNSFAITITQKEQPSNYLEISGADVAYKPEDLRATTDQMRGNAFKDVDSIVELEYKILTFATGALFKRWIDANKIDMAELPSMGTIAQ